MLKETPERKRALGKWQRWGFTLKDIAVKSEDGEYFVRDVELANFEQAWEINAPSMDADEWASVDRFVDPTLDPDSAEQRYDDGAPRWRPRQTWDKDQFQKYQIDKMLERA